jgi:hypothetical protein
MHLETDASYLGNLGSCLLLNRIELFRVNNYSYLLYVLLFSMFNLKDFAIV